MIDVDGFLKEVVKPMMENDQKANEVLAAKGNGGREKIADRGMAEELVTVDSGIENLNEGRVDDGGGDTTAGNGIKATHNGVSFLSPYSISTLGRLREDTSHG